MKALLLDPFHTGSHAHWAKGMQKHLSQIPGTAVELWTMPGRHWKWRMHGGGGEFARQAAAASSSPDLILTTDMLDVASLKGLLPAAWRNVPIVQYFHENQLTFPWNEGDAEKVRGLHHTYQFINIQSAVAADWVWFNSSYHRDVFIEAAEQFIKRMPDCKAGYSMNTLAEKSSVLPVGIDAPAAVDVERPVGTPPTILWNHRWSNDKGPDKFTEHLNDLEAEGHDFRLILCGQKFAEVPPELQSIRQRYRDRILHDGYADSHEMYTDLLQSSDFVLHEPVQEYFGVSVAEAMSHGVIPILKSAQAYPSWVPNAFLFKQAEERTAHWVNWQKDVLHGRTLAHATATKFYWPHVAHTAHEEIHSLFNLG